ncbi:putative glucan 1,3-beta-glucosidase A-like [Capsicum annuum]|nr:putative glucan 1,3-beta-glucosidase A-like [Capsicum annuum]KAF3676609.1 putative glucan 1,3-beta-glucosidase A-like [Capsicum annuum]
MVVLSGAINRRGTEKNYLTIVITTKGEVDMKIIVDEYQKMDNIPLDHAIDAKDTRGDYERAMMYQDDLTEIIRIVIEGIIIHGIIIMVLQLL